MSIRLALIFYRIALIDFVLGVAIVAASALGWLHGGWLLTAGAASIGVGAVGAHYFAGLANLRGDDTTDRMLADVDEYLHAEAGLCRYELDSRPPRTWCGDAAEPGGCFCREHLELDDPDRAYDTQRDEEWDR